MLVLVQQFINFNIDVSVILSTFPYGHNLRAAAPMITSAFQVREVRKGSINSYLFSFSREAKALSKTPSRLLLLFSLARTISYVIL